MPEEEQLAKKCQKLHEGYVKCIDMKVSMEKKYVQSLNANEFKRDVKCFNPLACSELVDNGSPDKHHCNPFNAFWGVLLAGRNVHIEHNMVARSQTIKIAEPRVSNDGEKHTLAGYQLSIQLEATYFTNPGMIETNELLVLPYNGGGLPSVLID